MGYCEEHDDLTVTEDGTIRRDKKDWSTYRKSNAFFLTYITLLGMAIFAAVFGCSYIGMSFSTEACFHLFSSGRNLF